jgi:ABC-type antimicrobial peptide transport system permease subunit
MSFDNVLEPYLRPWRLGATLFTALGLLALAVAAVGIYSVIAYSVSQRGPEMAVRVALGAQRRDILDLILRDGFALVAVGIAAGLVAASVAGRLVASLLFGVLPNDPSVLLTASLIICVVGAAGCLIPGWRAARADPVNALRSE